MINKAELNLQQVLAQVKDGASGILAKELIA